jgi:hypothetical protein
MSSNSAEAQFPSVLVVIVNYRNFWVTKPLQNVFSSNRFGIKIYWGSCDRRIEPD